MSILNKNKVIENKEVVVNSKEEIEIDSILNDGLEHFSTVQAKLLNNWKRKLKSNEDLISAVERYFKSKKLSEHVVKDLSRRFMLYIDGYHILEDLINDESISDIKILAHDNIRIKKYGDRYASDVKFKSKDECNRFINLVAVKNEVNLSRANAEQTFTDKDTNSKFRLRFTILTKHVNSNELPFLHVRKIPKKKYTEDQLIKFKLFNEDQSEYLKNKIINGDMVIFTGKGASGKTTMMNHFLDKIPHNKAGLIIQENDELFTYTHPEMLFQNILSNGGEGKIQYTLKDLSIKGLLIDLDYFGIGEIKGDEAISLLIAANTGHKCITGVHGNSATEAMNKLIDYMMWGSRYSREELCRMFKNMDVTICYMKDFNTNEISNIVGYDEETKDFIYDIIKFENK